MAHKLHSMKLESDSDSSSDTDLRSARVSRPERLFQRKPRRNPVRVDRGDEVALLTPADDYEEREVAPRQPPECDVRDPNNVLQQFSRKCVGIVARARLLKTAGRVRDVDLTSDVVDSQFLLSMEIDDDFFSFLEMTPEKMVQFGVRFLGGMTLRQKGHSGSDYMFFCLQVDPHAPRQVQEVFDRLLVKFTRSFMRIGDDTVRAHLDANHDPNDPDVEQYFFQIMRKEWAFCLRRTSAVDDRYHIIHEVHVGLWKHHSGMEHYALTFCVEPLRTETELSIMVGDSRAEEEQISKTAVSDFRKIFWILSMFTTAVPPHMKPGLRSFASEVVILSSASETWIKFGIWASAETLEILRSLQKTLQDAGLREHSLDSREMYQESALLPTRFPRSMCFNSESVPGNRLAIDSTIHSVVAQVNERRLVRLGIQDWDSSLPRAHCDQHPKLAIILHHGFSMDDVDVAVRLSTYFHAANIEHELVRLDDTDNTPSSVPGKTLEALERVAPL